MPRTRHLGVIALCAVLTAGLPVSARCQDRGEFELALVGGFPVGGLGRGLDRTAWGGSVYGARYLRGTSLSLGARLTLASLGSDLSDDLPGYTSEAPAGVRYRYLMVAAHLVVRVQPRQTRLTPYVETQAGIHYFLTQAYSGGSSSVPLIVGDAVITVPGNGASTLRSSVTPSIGVGGGLRLRLARFGGGPGSGRSPMTLLLDLQGRYLHGGTAEYLAPGRLSYHGGELVLDSRRSGTDLLVLSLGLSVRGAFAGR